MNSSQLREPGRCKTGLQILWRHAGRHDNFAAEIKKRFRDLRHLLRAMHVEDEEAAPHTLLEREESRLWLELLDKARNRLLHGACFQGLASSDRVYSNAQHGSHRPHLCLATKKQ